MTKRGDHGDQEKGHQFKVEDKKRPSAVPERMARVSICLNPEGLMVNKRIEGFSTAPTNV